MRGNYWSSFSNLFTPLAQQRGGNKTPLATRSELGIGCHNTCWRDVHQPPHLPIEPRGVCASLGPLSLLRTSSLSGSTATGAQSWAAEAVHSVCLAAPDPRLGFGVFLEVRHAFISERATCQHGSTICTASWNKRGFFFKTMGLDWTKDKGLSLVFFSSSNRRLGFFFRSENGGVAYRQERHGKERALVLALMNDGSFDLKQAQ